MFNVIKKMLLGGAPKKESFLDAMRKVCPSNRTLALPEEIPEKLYSLIDESNIIAYNIGYRKYINYGGNIYKNKRVVIPVAVYNQTYFV